jgi:hypothetical protein
MAGTHLPLNGQRVGLMLASAVVGMLVETRQVGARGPWAQTESPVPPASRQYVIPVFQRNEPEVGRQTSIKVKGRSS